MLWHISGSIPNTKGRLLLDWKELRVTKSLVFYGGMELIKTVKIFMPHATE
jgi:hypothetical protein